MDRLELFDMNYCTLAKWKRFLLDLSLYDNEEQYLAEYNSIKDAAISHIKESDGYARFNSVNMDEFAVNSTQFPSRNIYKISNNNRIFLSIDMKHANFSALNHFDADMFTVNGRPAETWESFLRNFTLSDHICKSKYIRQVVMGNCNPKRQVAYEKFLMNKIVTLLLESEIINIVSFSNDEIVIDITDLSEKERIAVRNRVFLITDCMDFPTHVEQFVLSVIYDGPQPGFCKHILYPENKFELKCIDPTLMPAILRSFTNQPVSEGDKVFLYEGRMAKYLNIPDIQCTLSNVNIDLPEDVSELLAKLNSCGHEAYVVGGCVRDSLLNIFRPSDWDICTSATPKEVMDIFKDYTVLPTGLQHGTVTVMKDGVGYEITTFRIDGEYKDNRRPESVTFTSDLFEDLSRRDFTINAMAYNPYTGLIDPFNGRGDLARKIIRCVGSPMERFSEDALRIVRAVRFACQLDFSIEDDTENALYKFNSALRTIAKERIRAELDKMIVHEEFSYVLMKYRNLFFQIVPQLECTYGFNQNNPYHDKDVFSHTLVALYESPKDLIIRLALLFHDIGKPHCFQVDDDGTMHFRGHAMHSAAIANEILSNLRYDNDTVYEVVQLIHFHDGTIECEKKYVKRWLNKIGEKQLRRLIEIRYSDILAQNENVDRSRLDKLDKIRSLISEVIDNNEPFCLKDLAVNGDDLMEIGYKQGVQIGIALRTLLDAVIGGEVENTKDSLMKFLKIGKGENDEE